VIGLTGAQRVGKSTLAEVFAKAHDIPYLKTDVSGVWKAMGKDPKIEYPIEERIAQQRVILGELEKQYLHAAKVSPLFVTDRTQICCAAYMLADIQRSTLKGQTEVAQFVVDFVNECIESANRTFSTIVLVQPGIPASEKEGSAPFCPAFMEHFNSIALGLLVHERLGCQHYYIPRKVLDIQARLQATTHAVKAAMLNQKLRSEQAQSAGALTLQ
jgi:hypothetical protein